MDSINTLKGYGKVGELDDRSSRKNTRKLLIFITCSAIVLGIVLISMLSRSLVPHHTTQTSAADLSIKAVCNVTRYPSSCFSSLSSSLESCHKSNPEELVKQSMQVSMNELSKLSSLPGKLIAKVNDNGAAQTALRDCQTLIEDAADQVNKSIQSMQVTIIKGEKVLKESKMINDIRSWLSGAMTNQETCLEGLEETKSSSNEEMKAAIKDSMEFTSNSLAIVSNIQTILENLHFPLHRKLMWLA